MAMKPLYWTRIQFFTPKPEKPEGNVSPESPPLEAVADDEAEEEVEEATEEEEEVLAVEAEEPSGPLWDELEEEEFNVTEFVDLFARNVSQPKKEKKKDEVKVIKVKVAKVLDSKRSQNVGIFIISLHLDITEVENAVYNFDTSTLDLEVLQQVYEVRGTDDEVSMIKAQLEANPGVPLDKPEMFLLDLSKINLYADRIFCFMFQATFSEDLESVHGKVSLLLNTIQMLLSNQSIKRIFGLILALGNYMNGGNRQRGQADGFGLEILPKLRDVKSKNTSITLLHFLVAQYIEKYEKEEAGTDKVKLPIPDPYSVERSANIQFNDLEGDLNNLDKNVTVCERRSEKVIRTSDKDHLEPFKERMQNFFKKAKKDLKSERKNLEKCKSHFDAVMKYFQFSGKGKEVTPHDFFSVWAPFCNDFMTIWQREQHSIVKRRIKEAEESVKKIKEEKKDIAKKTKDVGGLKTKLREKLHSFD